MKKTNRRIRMNPHKRDIIRTNPKKQHRKEANNHSKQPSHNHGMMRKTIMMHVRFKYAWHGKVHKQYYKLSGAHYATELHIEENTT